MKIFELTKEDTLILKGIAISFVLLGHLEHYLWAGAGGVALFLILSGYGLNLSCEEKGLNLFWNKRIKNVWLPYVIVGIFDVLVFRIEGVKGILFTMLGLDFGMIADKTMWYISFIILWYLVYYILAAGAVFAKDIRVKRAILFLGLIAAAPLVCWLYHCGVWHENSSANYYVLFFPLGVMLSFFRNIKVNEKLVKLFWFAVLFASSVYILRNYMDAINTTRVFAMAVQPLSMCQLISINGRTKDVLSWLGRYSYPIYLFEGIFLHSRNGLFWKLEMQLFIDVAYILVVLLNAVVFWNAYQKIVNTRKIDRVIRI